MLCFLKLCYCALQGVPLRRRLGKAYLQSSFLSAPASAGWWWAFLVHSQPSHGAREALKSLVYC